MDYYNYITPTGTVLPDTATVRDEVVQEYKAVLGPDLDTNPSTIQGRLIDLETNARISVIRNNCNLANQINPDLAEQNFLDAVCALSGVSRDGAEASIVNCDLSGLDGTFVPAGTLVANDDGVEWSLSSPVTIDDTGSVSGQFTATTTGPISAAAGTITTIVSGPLGLETVTNPNPASVGKNDDNDFELKTARKSQIALNSNRDALAIMSKVSAVPGVKSLSFRENQTDLPIVIDGKTLISHSTYIVVDGGLDLDIAQAYYEARSGGSGFNGDVEQVITDDVSQQNITIKFDRPTLKPKQIKITVSVGSGSQPTDDIKTALLSYADTQAFGVGVDISSFNLATHVSSKVASIFVTNCEIAEKGGEFVCGTIETKIFEKAVLNSGDDIEVLYV